VPLAGLEDYIVLRDIAASSSCIRAGCCGKTGEGRASEVPGSCSTLASGGEGSGGFCKKVVQGHIQPKRLPSAELVKIEPVVRSNLP